MSANCSEQDRVSCTLADSGLLLCKAGELSMVAIAVVLLVGAEGAGTEAVHLLMMINDVER
jgi:hypothetical protein